MDEMETGPVNFQIELMQFYILQFYSIINLHKLQRVQNRMAKSVCYKHCSNSNDNLSKLHWLPVNCRIKYKTVNLPHKIIHLNSTAYLASLITPFVPARQRRSAQSNLLDVPKCGTVAGSFAFVYHAPTIWNSIPSLLEN